jgi:signal transduction histidine kinase
MDLAAKDAAPSLSVSAARARTGVAFGLSWRLLVLTIVFIMLAQILILVPSLARYRFDYLGEKIDAAHLIITALEAAPEAQSTGQIDPNLRDRLLDQAGMLGMTVLRPNTPPRTLGPRVPPQIPMLYDLRGTTAAELMVDTLSAMAGAENVVMGVTGLSKSDPRVVVEVVLDSAPLRVELWKYSRRVLIISIYISVVAAALVYAAIQWLAVRPLRKLTASMTAFQQDPQDLRLIIAPKARGDEVGTAEQALADMQQQLRALLLEKERLAGVGFAVTKISHDLKNILATAQLESDRLESAPNVDPDVKHITTGIVRAIDRAVKLSADTIRFAREGLPEARKQALSLRAVAEDVRSGVQHALPATMIRVEVPAEITFAGDADLLQRALENLIRNAAEASAACVTLSHERLGRDDVLLVTDNGKGLPKKAVDNLFVPFSGSAKAGGTGLGLPIAREALRVQGGDIVLRSTGPGGSEFAVLLPVA